MASAASRHGRLATAVGSHLRAFLREPTHLALLFVLPPLVVVAYGRAMAAFPELPFASAVPETLGYVNGAVFAAAFLAGLVGLFQTVSAVQADRRLGVCGFGRIELFASRLATVLAVAIASALVSFGALAWQVSPAAPLAAFGALVLGAVLYGLLGSIVGAVLPRELEGSLALVFIADMDDALASGLVDVESDLVRLAPLHYPHALFEAAVLDGTVATGDVAAGLAYALVLALVALVAHARVIDSGGVLS